MTIGTGDTFAMARTTDLITEPVGDELVVYDQLNHEAHALKPLAAAVYTAADGRTSPAAMVAELTARLGEPVALSEVDAALRELAAVGLLEGSGANGVSRRRLLQVGGAVAAGTLVSSALVPALAAASGTCDATAASQIGLLVKNVSSGTYSFLTFSAGSGQQTSFTCDAGLNGSHCFVKPPSNWSATVPWVLDGHDIYPGQTCPSPASVTITPTTVSYSVPSSYVVVALYGHALGTTGQYCSGPFTSGAGGCTGTIGVC